MAALMLSEASGRKRPAFHGTRQIVTQRDARGDDNG
jgi:hypothetical protein